MLHIKRTQSQSTTIFSFAQYSNNITEEKKSELKSSNDRGQFLKRNMTISKREN